jgi:hypothetical protein
LGRRGGEGLLYSDGMSEDVGDLVRVEVVRVRRQQARKVYRGTTNFNIVKLLVMYRWCLIDDASMSVRLRKRNLDFDQ